MSFGFGGGAAFFLNEYVAVEAGLDYSLGSIKNKENSDLKMNFGGITFKFGFTQAFWSNKSPDNESGHYSVPDFFVISTAL